RQRGTAVRAEQSQPRERRHQHQHHGHGVVERVRRHDVRRELRHEQPAAERHVESGERVIQHVRTGGRHDILLADSRAQRLGHAVDDNKFKDSLWVHYADALSGGSPVYALNSNSGLLVNLATGTTAASLNGWGWQNGAYWLSQATTVTFAASGTHTLRIQVRED